MAESVVIGYPNPMVINRSHVPIHPPVDSPSHRSRRRPRDSCDITLVPTKRVRRSSSAPDTSNGLQSSDGTCTGGLSSGQNGRHLDVVKLTNTGDWLPRNGRIW